MTTTHKIPPQYAGHNPLPGPLYTGKRQICYLEYLPGPFYNIYMYYNNIIYLLYVCMHNACMLNHIPFKINIFSYNSWNLICNVKIRRSPLMPLCIEIYPPNFIWNVSGTGYTEMSTAISRGDLEKIRQMCKLQPELANEVITAVKADMNEDL